MARSGRSRTSRPETPLLRSLPVADSSSLLVSLEDRRRGRHVDVRPLGIPDQRDLDRARVALVQVGDLGVAGGYEVAVPVGPCVDRDVVLGRPVSLLTVACTVSP